jgi:hypothetical protein
MEKVGTHYKSFLFIIKCTLHGQSDNFLVENISDIFELSYQHNLWPTFYNTIRTNQLFLNSFYLNPHLVKSYDLKLKAIISNQLKRIHQLKKLAKGFEAKGVRAILLKGYVLANLYPQPLLRISGDTDFLVQLNQVDLA